MARSVTSSMLFCSSEPPWAKRSTRGRAVSSRIFEISAERARQTGEELAVHAREIEQALAGADERLASSAAAAAARVEEQVAGVENRLVYT
ncbi:MAG: hypothetical protein EOS59_33330, partial [Mesorhizobium sp.]